MEAKLRKASKARLMRLVKVKDTRKSMNCPQWLRDEWEKGNKDQMAQLFVAENFNKDILRFAFTEVRLYVFLFSPRSLFNQTLHRARLQESFMSKMQTIVSKRSSMKVVQDCAWYSEQEMKDELKWSASFT